MNIKTLAASAVLVGFAMPALADEFWVVRGPDQHCTVVDKRPATKEMTIVSPDGVTYKTRVEAMDAMKTVTVCK